MGKKKKFWERMERRDILGKKGENLNIRAKWRKLEDCVNGDKEIWKNGGKEKIGKNGKNG